MLVRGLSETILRADWRRFGPNGLIVVYSIDGKVGGVSNTWKRPRTFKSVKDVEINTKENGKYVINLKGEVVDVPPEGRVIFTNSEIEDWFELSGMCSD